MLASLEQYILVNGNSLSLGVLNQLIHLYSFIRGVLSSNGLLFSREAERIIFSLISDSDWDFLIIPTHPTAMRWLFQQDEIFDPISSQIINFCRSYNISTHQLNKHGKIVGTVDIHMLSSLILSGDNYSASMLVLLLQRLDEQYLQDDVIRVMDVILSILNILPEASEQFCLNKVSDAIRSLCYSQPPGEVFTSVLLLGLNILSFAPPGVLSEDAEWVPITVKVLTLFILNFEK